MTTISEITLTTGAQSFPCRMNRTVYRLRVVYRDADGGGWFMDFSDASGSDLLSGIPMRPGVDLLEQHQHLGIGHLYVAVDGKADREADYSDMGSKIRLFYRAPS